MTNAFGHFLTSQVSGQQNGQSAQTQGSAETKVALGKSGQPGSDKFLAMIMNKLNPAQQSGELSDQDQKALSKLLNSANNTGKAGMNLTTLDTKSGGRNTGQTFNLNGLGSLSQEALAQLTAQFQSGEGAGPLTLFNAPPSSDSPFSTQALLGLDQPKQGSLDGLLQQINELVQNTDLQTGNPDLHGKLTALQQGLNKQIASGDIPSPTGDVKDLATEINAMILSGYDNQSANLKQGSLQALQSQLKNFLTPSPAETNGLQKQFGSNILGLLNNNNFSGFSARGQLFGAAQGKAQPGQNSGALNNLAAQLNAVEPGAQSPSQNNNFMQLLQQIATGSAGGAMGHNGQGTLFSPDSTELNFSGTERQATETQQNQLTANTNPLGLQSAGNMSVQAPQAGSSHPASQTLAAQMAKNAANGQTKSMTLHLHPRELGRVHIQMELSRDNTMKARVTTERSETHSLLQKDSDSLQRALENAGIDFGGEGLEFELADGEDAFDEFLEDNGGGFGNPGQGGDQQETEIIETTLTWPDGMYMDPETGQARYNILA